MRLAHRNKGKGFFGSLANYGHTRIVLYHAQWGWRDKTQFCSETYKNLRHTRSCESTLFWFHLHCAQKNSILHTHTFQCWQGSANKTFSYMSDIGKVAKRENENQYINRLWDTSHLLIWINTYYRCKNCHIFFCLWHCDN